MKNPILGAFRAPSRHKHMLGSMQHLHVPMRKFGLQQEVDYIVVGVGSAGGVLLQRLARAGFNVVGLEAGPFWDTERDWVSTKRARINSTGTTRELPEEHPLALGAIIVAKVWAAVPCTGRRLHRGFILPTLKSTQATELAWTGPSATRTSSRTTNNWSLRCRWQARLIIHGGILMATLWPASNGWSRR